MGRFGVAVFGLGVDDGKKIMKVLLAVGFAVDVPVARLIVVPVTWGELTGVDVLEDGVLSTGLEVAVGSVLSLGRRVGVGDEGVRYTSCQTGWVKMSARTGAMTGFVLRIAAYSALGSISESMLALTVHSGGWEIARVPITSIKTNPKIKIPKSKTQSRLRRLPKNRFIFLPVH